MGQLHLRDKWTNLSKKKRYFTLYTGCFVLVCLIVFSWYFTAGRTFIWKSDGWNQHYKALVYYGRYLRSIVKNLLFNHELIIPAWDFSIGEGSDILTALHYYVIGDPLNLLSVFVPARHTWVLYDFLIILRLYLSGLFFSLLCFETGQRNQYGILAGAMTYTFCLWALFNAARHPYFLNPMVYMPLLVMGVERILRGRRPWLFVGAVFLSAISNFYFFYMLVLATIIYVAARLISLYRKKLTDALKPLLHIFLFAVLGTLLAAVILLPIIAAFLGSSRMGVENGTRLFYPLSYYSKLPSIALSTSSTYWLCMGYSVVTIPALFLLFRKKKQGGLLKSLFLVGMIIILLPTLGQAFNGFSYISNRWNWAFALICAYILSAMWPSLMNLSRKDALFLLGCMAGYLFACLLLEYSRTTEAFASLAIMGLLLLVLFPTGDGQPMFPYSRRQVLALGLTLVSIFSHSYWKNAFSAGNYAAEMIPIKDVSELTQTEAEAVKWTAAEDGIEEFYRYSGRGMHKNSNMISQVSSTDYYWSIANPYVTKFRSKIGIREIRSFNYEGYDDRTALLALASVRYLVVPAGNSAPAPYGFTYINTINLKQATTTAMLDALKAELGMEELTSDQIKIITNATASRYDIYRNDYALPLAYTYEDDLSVNAWEGLNEVEKQEAMLQAAVVPDETANKDVAALKLTSKPLDYTVSCNGNGVTMDGNSFVVTSKKAKANLKFKGLENNETYFIINGLTFKGASTYDLYFGDESVDPLNLYTQTRWDLLSHSDQQSIIKNKTFWDEPTRHSLILKSSAGISKDLSYETPYYQFYSGRHDFAINLDYTEEAVNSITITFPYVGTYSFDSLNVICQPMDNYVSQVQALGEDTLDHLEVGTDTVTGTIALNTDKWLCFSIPYSTGWKAYIDGEEAPLYQANGQYMAARLTAGEHTVQLIYKNRLQTAGACVSVIALIILVTAVVVERKGKKFKSRRRPHGKARRL